MSIGGARTALPIQIKLKNPSQVPHPKQYPLKPEGILTHAYHKFLTYAYHKFLKKMGY
jgi:hypothetical protein